MTDPDTIASAVIRHIEDSAKTDNRLGTPPTDAEVFDGVPDAVVDVPTEPMRLPHDIVPNPFVGDENWEEDEPTAVIRRTKTHDKLDELQRSLGHEVWPDTFGDPTGCMM